MLGLYFDGDGRGEWIDLPQRTLVPEHDPCAGMTGMKRLLGIEPGRRMMLNPVRSDLLVASRADIRPFGHPNPASAALDIAETFGPLVAIGTPRMFSEEQPPSRLTDLRTRDGSGAALRSMVHNTPEQRRPIHAIDSSTAYGMLSVRSIRDAAAPVVVYDDAYVADPATVEAAFDEVMAVVKDYVASTGCRLTSANTVLSQTGTFMYSATVVFRPDRHPDFHTHQEE